MKSFFALAMSVLLIGGALTLMPQAQSNMDVKSKVSFTHQKNNDPSVTTRDFVEQAGQINLYAIKTSNLARKHAYNETVRQFGRQIHKDHSRATDHLEQSLLSADLDQLIPSENLNRKYQLRLETLQNILTDQFEARYIDDQVILYEEAITLYSSYAKEGDSAVLRKYAVRILPDLEQHRDTIKRMDGLVLSGR